MKGFWLFGLTAAIALGYALRHVLEAWGILLLAALNTLVAWRLFARRWTKPFKPTRAWARALYAQGMISMEELNQFYAEHEDPDDEISHPKPQQ